jgi:hypothetical protein
MYSPQIGPSPEIVMKPGSMITARTPWGVITVRAGEGFERTYYWGDCEGSVVLWPRYERWYGSLGIYFPGPGFHWQECEGVARAVVEEGQQHFATEDEALEWIARQQDWMPHVYTRDGLVIGWRTVIPYRKQLNVDVWQIFVNGQKPIDLRGSQDDAITRSTFY